MSSQALARKKATTGRVERATLHLMAERYKVEIGRAIARRRQELGLTQKDLANRTHYKEAQTVSRWERGENLPVDLDAVVAALEWRLSDLVGGVSPPNQKVARKLGIEYGRPASVPDMSRNVDPLERVEARLDQLDAQVSAVLDAVEALRIQLAAGVLAETQRPAEGRTQRPASPRRRRT